MSDTPERDRAHSWPSDWPGEGPIDLAVHDLPHASSQTEWWYVNAHLTVPGGRHFSLFAAFFRAMKAEDEETKAPIFGHSLTWALSDWERKEYTAFSRVDPDARRIGLEKVERGEATKDERINRAFREMLERGGLPQPDRVFETEPVVALDQLDLDFGLSTFRKLDSGAYRLTIRTEDGRAGAELEFTPKKVATRHGADGVVKSPDGADMFYYFIPRCDVTGTLRADGVELPVVDGQGWYDHEFGRHLHLAAPDLEDASRAAATRDETAADAPKASKQEVAWNWLAVQLADGRDLSAYTLVDDKTGEELDQRAIVIDADGTRTEYTDVALRPVQSWRSTRTFNSFPTRWAVRIESLDLSLEMDAIFDDQEFITLISKSTFWEGVCSAKGQQAGTELQGVGYIERSGMLSVQTLDDFFGGVGEEVRKSVQSIIPFDPTTEQLTTLVASEERKHLMVGVDSDTLVDSIIRPVRAIVDRGGKSWRSYAALACCDVVGGDSRDFVQWLSLPEFLHVGSLIVDDVQDGSTTRRGGPPCHVLYGDAIAINAGTAAYFMGHQLLENRSLSSRNRLRIYDLYFQALRAGHAGQALDITGFDGAAREAIASGDYHELERRVLAANRLKTAVPASMLAQMGAVAGGGTDEQVNSLGRYFEEVGLAFQIVDDLLNLKGFQGDLKERGEDIVAGKMTLPIVRGLQKLDEARRTWVAETVLSRPDDPEVVGRVINLLDRCGALDETQALAIEMVEEAWQRVEPTLEDSLPKLMMRAFGWYVLDRHY